MNIKTINSLLLLALLGVIACQNPDAPTKPTTTTTDSQPTTTDPQPNVIARLTETIRTAEKRLAFLEQALSLLQGEVDQQAETIEEQRQAMSAAAAAISCQCASDHSALEPEPEQPDHRPAPQTSNGRDCTSGTCSVRATDQPARRILGRWRR